MANSLTSNVTRQLARVFLKSFDNARVVTKSVNTQLLSGKFSRKSGTTVDFKRAHDYTSKRTSSGDISGNKDDIQSGKATGTVQNFFTVSTEWSGLEDAVQSDQLDEILAPMATRICNDLESDFIEYMTTNCGGWYAQSGTYGTAISTWQDVAAQSAYMESLGVPMDKKWCLALNPFTATTLAGASAANGGQISISPGSGDLVDSAYHNATIAKDFAGFRVLRSSHLHAFTTPTITTADGLINDASVAHAYTDVNDTLTLVLTVDDFGAETFAANSLVGMGIDIAAVSGALNLLSHTTRQAIVDAAGANMIWQGIVTANTTFVGGAGTITVSAAPVYESGGQYNSVSQQIANNDVVNLYGGSATLRQPNLAFHPDAFGLGTVKLNKLYEGDTVATTKDGMSIRVTKYSDGDANKQMVRFDLLPAYATLNPWFAHQAWG